MNVIDGVRYVSSFLTLVAFVVGVLLMVFRSKESTKEKLYANTPESERAKILPELVGAPHSLDTSILRPDQIQELLKGRDAIAQRKHDGYIKITALALILFAAVWVISILCQPSSAAVPPANPTSVDPSGGHKPVGGHTAPSAGPAVPIQFVAELDDIVVPRGATAMHAVVGTNDPDITVDSYPSMPAGGSTTEEHISAKKTPRVFEHFKWTFNGKSVPRLKLRLVANIMGKAGVAAPSGSALDNSMYWFDIPPAQGGAEIHFIDTAWKPTSEGPRR